MRTVVELLREADPAGFEPQWSARERGTVRQAVLGAAHDVEKARPRVRALVTTAAIAVVAIAIVAVHVSRTAVDVLAAVRLEVRLAEETPTLGLREAVPEPGRRIYLHQEAIVTNSDIAQAEVVPGGSPSTFSIAVTFNPQGAARMRRATERHVGRPIAILIDGKVVLAPVVRSAVSASAVITGDYTRAEAERIAAGILGR